MGRLKDFIASSTVHLCIDMQRLFDRDGIWPTPWLPRVLPIVVNIVERAPARTLFTRFIPAHSPEDCFGTWRAYFRKWPNVTLQAVDRSQLELVEALQRFVPPARVFDKRVYSGFADGRLHHFLRRNAIDTLLVTGSETDVCVLSTVLSAVDLGYRVIVVKDALCSSNDSSHDSLMELYETRFDVQIELASSEEVLANWNS
jgi:nicotinamidase-related amidase